MQRRKTTFEPIFLWLFRRQRLRSFFFSWTNRANKNLFKWLFEKAVSRLWNKYHFILLFKRNKLERVKESPEWRGGIYFFAIASDWKNGLLLIYLRSDQVKVSNLSKLLNPESCAPTFDRTRTDHGPVLEQMKCLNIIIAQVTTLVCRNT